MSHVRFACFMLETVCECLEYIMSLNRIDIKMLHIQIYAYFQCGHVFLVAWCVNDDNNDDYLLIKISVILHKNWWSPKMLHKRNKKKIST